MILCWVRHLCIFFQWTFIFFGKEKEERVLFGILEVPLLHQFLKLASEKRGAGKYKRDSGLELLSKKSHLLSTEVSVWKLMA